jgi:DNA-binding XRE family transcriptional regulator
VDSVYFISGMPDFRPAADSAYKQYAFKQNAARLLLLQREKLQKRLGARIRRLRLKRGWTQDEFADRAGLHRTQVGAFETGRMNITLASLHLVAQTLGVRIVDLFKGVEDVEKR